jgi:coenzyme F420-reducing hydrogenase alpha subunit
MTESVLNHYICKIEGHGNLKLNAKSGKAKLEIEEGERLFERLVLEHPFLDAPFITARICGICPTAHTLASILAIEDAFNVKVTPNIVALRKALLAGQIIQSHSLHLFFLALPDYLGVVNAIELHETKPEIYKNAVALKKLGDKIVEVLGGRAVHPTAPTVGGFLSVPSKEGLRKLAEDLEAHLHLGLETVELFSGFDYPSLKRETEYLATRTAGQLTYYGGDTIISNKGLKTPLENYPYAFKEEIRNDSPTKYGTRDGHGFMVGALARLSLDSKHLNPKAAYAYTEIWGKTFPTYNSFHNNVAQAIEIVHLIEEVIFCLREAINDRNQIYKVPFEIKAGQGIGAVEAPRGTLYHGVKIDDQGFIKLYDIVTPTVQNLVNLEEDADELLKHRGKKKEEELYKEVEMLIRAYDPCITCSVH